MVQHALESAKVLHTTQDHLITRVDTARANQHAMLFACKLLVLLIVPEIDKEPQCMHFVRDQLQPGNILHALMAQVT